MLAASHRITAGHVGVPAALSVITVSSPTRALPYMRAGVKPAPLGVSLLPAAFFGSTLAPRVMPCFRRHCPGGPAESAVPCCCGVAEPCAFAAY